MSVLARATEKGIETMMFCHTESKLIILLGKSGRVVTSRCFLISTVLDELVPFQRVLPGECLPAAAVTQEWLLSGVSFAMTLQIVLTVEGQCAHVTRVRPTW